MKDYLKEHQNWFKYKTFMGDYDYKKLQGAIDKVSMYDVEDERRMEFKKILDQLVNNVE